MRPLYLSGMILLLAMLGVTALHWINHPVRRDRIQPVSLNYRINVNTADVATLSLLSGISTTIGQYIIEDRQKNGPFKTLADLDRVKRLGPVTLVKIAPYISFEEQ